MWMNFLDSEVVKFIINVVNGLVKIVDNVGLLQTALTALGGIFVKKKWGDILFPSKQTIQEKTQELQQAMEQAQENFKNNPNTENRQAKEDAEKNYATYQESVASNVPEVEKQVAAETELNETLSERTDTLGDVAEAADDVTDSVVVMGNEGQVAGDKIESGAKKGTKGFKSLTNAAKQYLFSMAAMYVVSTVIEGLYEGVKALVNVMDDSVQSAEELHDEYIEASDALSSCTSEVSSLESELKTTNDKIEELMSQGTLSFVEQEELERLQSVSAELERQLNITKTLQGSLQTGTSAAAMKAANAYLDTSFSSKESKTERQETAKETGSTIGKYAGMALGALLVGGAIALTAATGGAGAASIPAALSASAGWIGVGGMAGSAIGEGIGGSVASSKAGKVYDQEQTISEAIKSMNKTRDELIKARDEAYEAYASDPGNDKFKEEYSKAADDLATYDETMATRMTQISQYYNSIMQGWDQAEPEVQETARQLGDMIDAYNIEMGDPNAKVNAIDRIFGEEADTKLQSVKAKLHEMAKAGKDVDLKEAFGGDTAAYDAFIKRLDEMGIYTYECEDAFVELAAAEAKAAVVNFSDIAKDINGITKAISGAKDALAEFMESGILSVSTVADLEGIFNTESVTEEIKDAYEQYLGVMLSGNASIADARQATADLVQKYIEEQITLGNLNSNQKQVYISQLKQLGVSNAEEFVTKELQQTGIQKLEETYNNKNLGLVDKEQEIQKIISLYGLEEQAVNSLIEKLRQKNALEENKGQAEAATKAYNDFIAGYAELERKSREAQSKFENDKKALENQYGSDVVNFNADDWEAPYSARSGKYTNKDTGEELSLYRYSELQEGHKKYLKDLKVYQDEVDAATNAYAIKKSEGIRDGYLAGDGSISQAIAGEFEAAETEIQNQIDDLDDSIDTEFTIDFELEFAKPDMINTITGITEALEKYQTTLDILNETCFDGQVISEDFYNTLREQIGETTVGVEDFFDAIDTSNGYVVKNAELLKKLTDRSRKVQAQNAKVAKSQARLEYYELTKEMSKYIKVEDGVIITDAKQVVTLAAKANALAKVISKYSMLELQLLGAANAYDEFEKAQQADSEVDFMSSAEDMVLALGQAFNTGELGTETAQAAIKGVIPESVYKDIEALDTAEEKMAAIYDYFKNGKIAQYFDLEFDEDGNITAVEAKLGNMRKFIEDGITNGVFQGDWQNFEYSEEFLTGLTAAEDKLGYFAEKMKVSKEIALAMIKKIEDSDIGHIVGNYGSLFDVLTPDALENSIYNTTQAISNLNEQLANGSIDAKEYAKQMYGLKGAYDRGLISSEEYETGKQKWEEQKSKGAVSEQAYNEGMYGLESAEDALFEESRKKASVWFDKKKELEAYQDELKSYDQTVNGLKLSDEGQYFLDKDGNKMDIDVDSFMKKYTDVSTKVKTLTGELAALEEPTELELTFNLDKIQDKKQEIENSFGEIVKTVHYQWNEELGKYEVSPTLDEKSEGYSKIVEFVGLLNEEHAINLALSDDTKTVEETIGDVAKTLNDIATILQTGFEFIISDEGRIEEFRQRIDEATKDRTTTVTVVEEHVVDYLSEPTLGRDSDGKLVRGYTMANGTAHASGTAFADGNWGAPKTETALTGELGPEILVRNGKWTIVGENGAEFTQVKKGDIIFNHKQSKSLLEHGYVTGRGKAYAGGTVNSSGSAYAFSTIGMSGANVALYPYGSSKTQWEGTGYDGPDDLTYSLQAALESAADSVGEFEETIDWIETRMEELDQALGLYSAALENAIGAADKNTIIDSMIEINESVKNNALAGAKYYENYAQQYLAGMDNELILAAKNGAISISEFTKEHDEATVNAIQKYREYDQKASELYQKAEEAVTDIRQHAKQQFDNIDEEYNNKISLKENQKEQFEAHNDLLETDKGFASEDIYAQIQGINNAIIGERAQQIADLQTKLNDGSIVENTQDWYDAVNTIADYKSEIVNLQTENENLQDSINELHWEKFDLMAKKLEGITSEIDNLLTLLDEVDAVDHLGNWTSDGITSLALLAQQMEAAEAEAQSYKEQIAYLEKNWKSLGYTQEEYVDKLDELKSGQYDAIKSYNDAKDAIVDLNKVRVDAIKKGIEKEIEAYEDLIEKKKESLDADKNAHDYQNKVQESTKNIADIQRKISALSGDNSASAIAKRKKLEAELAEAKAELEETYYDRSIENQQTALDNELESFKETKDAEIEGWEKYLENLEAVVADSLEAVKENTNAVLETLKGMQEHYGLAISESIISPWEAGESAIQAYGTKLNVSLAGFASMFGLTVDELAEKLGTTTAGLVSSLDITTAQLASNLGLTNEQMAEKLGITTSELNGMMDLTIQQLASRIGVTIPTLAKKLGTTTAGLAGNLDMTISQFASKMGLSVHELAGKFGMTAENLADKLGITYQELTNPFELSMSATTEGLKELAIEYANILRGMVGDSQIAASDVDDVFNKYINKNSGSGAGSNSGSSGNSKNQQKAIAIGGRINASGAKIYSYAGSNEGYGQYFANDPVYTVLDEKNGYVLVRHHKLSSGYTGWFKKSDIKAYAKGTTNLNKSGIVNIDELGEELVLGAKNGRLTYLEKGSGVIPADVTSNLMSWGELNPQDMLDRNRPTVGVHPEIHNTQIQIDNSIAELIHIDKCDQSTLPDVEKIVNKALDKHMQNLNNSLKRYTRG
jgi:hypothetical protein